MKRPKNAVMPYCRAFEGLDSPKLTGLLGGLSNSLSLFMYNQTGPKYVGPPKTDPGSDGPKPKGDPLCSADDGQTPEDLATAGGQACGMVEGLRYTGLLLRNLN